MPNNSVTVMSSVQPVITGGVRPSDGTVGIFKIRDEGMYVGKEGDDTEDSQLL